MSYIGCVSTLCLLFWCISTLGVSLVASNSYLTLIGVSLPFGCVSHARLHVSRLRAPVIRIHAFTSPPWVGVLGGVPLRIDNYIILKQNLLVELLLHIAYLNVLIINSLCYWY